MAERKHPKLKRIEFGNVIFDFLKPTQNAFILSEDNKLDNRYVLAHNGKDVESGKHLFIIQIDFIKEVKACSFIKSTSNPFVTCKHPEDLEPFVKESGFVTVDDWLNYLWSSLDTEIPECTTKTFKTFYLYYIYELPKYPLSSTYTALREKPSQ